MSQLEFNNSVHEEAITYFADVILPLPIPKLYTYRIPSLMVDKIFVGSRIIVQFGVKKVYTAIVSSIHTNPPKVYEAKNILELLEETPLINSYQFKLFNWISEYYMCTLGEVINAAIPSGLKITSQSKIQLNPTFKKDESEYELSEKEERIIAALRGEDSLNYDEIARIAETKNISPLIKSLITKRAILVYEEVKEKYSPKVLRKIKLCAEFVHSKERLEELFKTLEKKPSQVNALLKYLQTVPILNNPEANEGGLEKNYFIKSIGSSSLLNTLIKKKIFEEFHILVSRFPEIDQASLKEIQLTDSQQKAKEEILHILSTKDTVLLFGVTGSGKTEVYIELLKNAILGGSQALYLLPEIALTTQLVARLQKVFGDKMGVYHSKFSDNERVEIWQGVTSGKYSIVIGVRSSIFLPFDNLGLIIIDEEHEGSYKQYDPAPRYHARDTALMLAKFHNAKTILGSATPSIESYYNALEGNWGLVRMDKRYGGAQLPEIILVDLIKEKRDKTIKNEFSSKLLEEMSYCMEKKEQVILFQNRRGYSPVVACEACNYVPKCLNCAVSLTYHLYKGEINCHYCGHSEPTLSSCPACGSGKIKTIGFGTEKIEDDLKIFLPSAKIQRMDLDTTRKKNSYQKIIEDFEKGETNVLIGTQMVTKGFDFGKVSLVGIFDIDRLIHFPDFRSFEKTFQLVMQVSGRAGRREIKGKVIIQTNKPQQLIFEHILENDFIGLYKKEIEERKRFLYPPFARLIKITCKNTDEKKVAITASKLKEKIAIQLGQNRTLGPQAPLINKIRNYYLQDILIKFERNKINLTTAKGIINECIKDVLSSKELKDSFIHIDVDPI